VDAHSNELDRHRAVLIMDSGAGAPRGLMLHGRSDLADPVRTLIAPLAAFGAGGVSLEASFDMDHAPFLVAGVPAFSLWVDDGDYDSHHHAVTDTFDKVLPVNLSLDTAALAASAFLLANSDQPGKRLSTAEADAILARTGLEPLRAIIYR
jgi:Zn-dependent M28 family amino/carboxypeptidase